MVSECFASFEFNVTPDKQGVKKNVDGLIQIKSHARRAFTTGKPNVD